MHKPLMGIVLGLIFVLGAGSAGALKPAEKQGPLEHEAIRRVIQQHIGEVRDCYQQEMDKHPTLAGELSVRFRISGAGAVTEAAVMQSTLNSPSVERCVITSLRSWVFPKARGETVVNYPFAFRPVNE